MAFQQRREQTPTSVAERVLAIFGAFLDGGPALTLSEISEHTGLPITTSLRLIRTLTECGALERRADRRYEIGHSILDLAAAAPTRGPVRTHQTHAISPRRTS